MDDRRSVCRDDFDPLFLGEAGKRLITPVPNFSGARPGEGLQTWRGGTHLTLAAQFLPDALCNEGI